MFVDYWCKKCGKKIACNLYKTDEERWSDGKWKEHWKELLERRKAEHECD